MFGILYCRRKISTWISKSIQIIKNILLFRCERQRNQSDFMKILSFPIMWEILQFYGYIDEWCFLMTFLWNDANRVWNRNIKAFEFWGRDFIRYSRVLDIESSGIWDDISSLFWRQSNYIKKLFYIDWRNKIHVCWIVNVILKLRSGMILSIINDISTYNFGWHVWVMKWKDFETSDLPIIINTEREVKLKNLLLGKFDSEVLLSKVEIWCRKRTPFIVKKINANEAVMYYVQVLSINLICDKMEYWNKKYYSSLNLKDLMKNKDMPKLEANADLQNQNEFSKRNDKLNNTKYKTISICSCYFGEFLKFKEKFKWLAKILHIIVHSHNFNQDKKALFLLNKHRNIYIIPNRLEDYWSQGEYSSPFREKLEFYKKCKSSEIWAAKIAPNFEIAGLSYKDENALILKQFSCWIFELTFVIKWVFKEWILIEIEDLYWQFELSYKKKSEYESILNDLPGFINCLKHNPNDYLFLVNQKSIIEIMPYSFKSMINLSLADWKLIILNFDDKIFELSFNKIRNFWEKINRSWLIEIFASKVVFERIWKNNYFCKAFKSNPFNKISIHKICSFEASESGIIVSHWLAEYSYWLRRDMNIVSIKSNNNKKLRSMINKEYLHNSETYRWIKEIKVFRIPFKNTNKQL